MNFIKTLRGKSLTIAQNLICFILIAIMCIMSFGTIFTVSYPIDSELKTQITDTLNQLSQDDSSSFKIKEDIDVNLAFVVKSISAVSKVIKSVSAAVEELQQSANGGTASTAPGTEGSDTELLSQELIDLVVFMFAVIASFKAHWLVGVCNILLISLVVVLPVTVIFSTVTSLLALVTNTNNPGKASHKISKAFYRILSVFPMLLLILVFLPDVKFGGAVYGILALCSVGLVIGLLVSRIKKYEGDDFKYINILQIASAVSLVGYILFFINIVKSQLLNSVFSMLAGHAVNEIVEAATTQKAEFDFFPVLLTLILVVAIYAVINSLTKIVTRIACMSKSKSPASIFDGMIGLAVVIVPLIMMNSSMELKLSSEQKSSFIACIIGIFLILAVEIFLTVAPKKLCPGCSKSRCKEIATGSYINELTDDVAEAENISSEVVTADDAIVAEEAPVAQEATEELEEVK